jgi:hypothetical protein
VCPTLGKLGNVLGASMGQKKVMLNSVANPFEQNWIWLREESVFELSSVRNMRSELIRIYK